MRGINSADPVIETFPAADALPSDARAVLAAAAPGLFGTLPWWDTVLHHAMPPGASAAFVTIRSSGKALAVVPMLRGGGKLTSLTTPYSCAFAPALAAGLDHASRVVAMTALARFGRPAGVVRLDALPAEWDGLTALEAGTRQAGLVPLRFDHFGNWHEDVTGLDWSAYLSRRPGALRETIRRRLRRAEKLPDARFDLFTEPAQIEQAADAFESVYRRSWKEPEPFPTFNVALMRATAATGQLRLGVWSIGSESVAVQFWVVGSGEATVLKLAHDEAFKAHSPGTVLSALMLRHLLDNEKVTQIDFGRGDDDYKKGWATDRRQRIGVLLANPWSVNGALQLALHAAGKAWLLWR
ncbi:MAG TPA: GNAT family N-acetyltransferase [Acetobacteraceae bacterium]|jgi:CelD/BcsL family acetyltransferase involved in cellulose biosynthesis|nr:GNAT family N-acetyltransferase [Acetobacteraceae bacterium]